MSFLKFIETESIMNECPCKDCLVIPICRHKYLISLLECEVIREYLMKYTFSMTPTKRRINLRQGVIDLLKPTQWNIDMNGYFTRFKRRKEEV